MVQGVVLALACLVSSTVCAETEVPDHWSLVPSGLSSGDKSRLLSTGNPSHRFDGITDVSRIDAQIRTGATLSALALANAADDTGVALNETFAATTLAYTADVANAVTRITVKPTTTDAGATVAYLDGDDMALADADSAIGFQVDLDEGANTVKIKVTAQDTANVQTYELTVTRAPVGICGRTQQVRDAILDRTGVSACADVTTANLAAIGGRIRLDEESISALLPGDFAGLTALEELNLGKNALTTLPADIFAGLTKLTHLFLRNNSSLTTLPAGVFTGLASLKFLFLNKNTLTTLPAGVFAGRERLERLDLDNNGLDSLPAGVFDGLTSLRELELNGNGLVSLPPGVFADLTALARLDLSGNPGPDGDTSTQDFLPAAVASASLSEIPIAGGEVTLSAAGSDGGPWGDNVTYLWELTDPSSGVTVAYAPDNTGAQTTATVAGPLTADALTFTLTMDGRGGSYAGTAAAEVVVATGTRLRTLEIVDAGGNPVLLDPAFAPGTFTYAASVANGVGEITVTATVKDAGATFEFLDADDNALADADTNEDDFQVSLTEGANVVKTRVTAPDRVTTRIYEVTITRAEPPVLPSGSILVSNLDQDLANGNEGFDNDGLAQKFTVKAGQDYTLTSVTVKVGNRTSKFSAAIHEVDESNSLNPAAAPLYVFTTPGTMSSGNRTFTARPGATLKGGTSYFLFLTSITDASFISVTKSSNLDSGSVAGWTITRPGRIASGSGNNPWNGDYIG